MNSANRTLAFVLVAVGSVGIAVAAHRMYQPSAVNVKSDVGTAFYPDFQDPSAATSLAVAAYNTTSNKVDEFRVEKRDGRWRIPSHHNYPADAKDRLAKTAASMIGVTRGQLVTDTATSHARLNLLDPLDKAAGGTEGRGSRITLKAGDTVLTDLIIGKKDEGGGDRYYVRRADEDRVYLAEVRPNLSTKFTDWIQPNVLDATAATFREIDIERYSVEFDGPRGKIAPGVKSHLTRDSSSDEWKLKELPEGKKLKTQTVNQIVSALADMKIVGVRPKTPGIAAAFRGDKDAPVSNLDLYDMQDKGYFNTPDGLKSKEGDFFASTAEAITYQLRFGSVVTGDEVNIEIGDSKPLTEEEAKKKLEEKSAAGPEDAKLADAKEGEKPEGDKKDDEKKETKKENRFLFVTALIDERLLGEPPVEPTKPEAPAGYKPKEKPADAPMTPVIPGFNKQGEKAGEKPAAPAEKKKETSAVAAPPLSLGGPGPDVQEEKKGEDAKPEDAKPTEEKPQENKPAAPADGQPAASATGDEKKPEAPKDPFAEYEAALKKYEQELDEYKVKKGEYEDRLKKANERVKTLNARFADWYYVIPADVFNTINVKPEELVEPEGTSATPGGAPGAGLPPGLQLPPGLNPPAATPAAEPKTDGGKADADPAAPQPKEAADTNPPAPEAKKPE
jgi:hypothetical protein